MAMHTPTPWVVDPQYPSEVQTIDLKTIASSWHEYVSGAELTITGVLECSLQESAANAAFIVRAVNAHDALLTAARTALSALEAQEDKSHKEHPAAEVLREAIALAQESK